MMAHVFIFSSDQVEIRQMPESGFIRDEPHMLVFFEVITSSSFRIHPEINLVNRVASVVSIVTPQLIGYDDDSALPDAVRVVNA